MIQDESIAVSDDDSPRSSLDSEELKRGTLGHAEVEMDS